MRNSISYWLETARRLDRRYWLVRATIRATFIEATLLVFLLIAAATVPMFLGHRTVVILSGSMEPTILTGAAVVASPIPSSQVQVGDILVFSSGTESTLPQVHRVVAIQEEGGVRSFTTRGDANAAEDANILIPPRTAWRISYNVPFAGYLIYLITNPLGLVFMIGFPAAILLFTNTLDWFKKRTRSVPATA